MKAFILRNQFESYIDNIEVSSDRVTILLHSHLEGNEIDKKQLMAVRDLEKRRVLITISEFKQVAGLNEKPKNLPGQTGGEKTK